MALISRSAEKVRRQSPSHSSTSSSLLVGKGMSRPVPLIHDHHIAKSTPVASRSRPLGTSRYDGGGSLPNDLVAHRTDDRPFDGSQSPRANHYDVGLHLVRVGK